MQIRIEIINLNDDSRAAFFVSFENYTFLISSIVASDTLKVFHFDESLRPSLVGSDLKRRLNRLGQAYEDRFLSAFNFKDDELLYTIFLELFGSV